MALSPTIKYAITPPNVEPKSIIKMLMYLFLIGFPPYSLIHLLFLITLLIFQSLYYQPYMALEKIRPCK